MVTLVGAGGCGKTRLALQAASGLLEEFPYGVWLVELATLSDPALVPQVVVKTLGLSEQGERSPPEIRVLATSREALSIPGEILFYIPSLSTPGAGEPLAGEKATGYEAVRLFQERAAACLAGFRVTDENASAIAQVCRRLDGIPLAIELAAARVRMLSVEQIAAHLDDRFHFLTSGGRTALPRHKTLRAAIDWSYALLSEQESVLLRRLSAFSGSWTLEAAEVVCTGNGLMEDEILDCLAGLVSKSMIIVLQAPCGAIRYTQLETIRQYGHEKLQQAGEETWCLQQHLEYFLRFAEIGDRKLRGSESLEWMHRMEEEYANLRAALKWCYGAGQGGEAGVKLTIASHWLLSPSFNLGYTLLYLGDDRQAASFFTQALNLSKLLEGELRIKSAVTDCLAGFAAVAATRGKAGAAARLYGAADAQYQALLQEGETIDSLIDLVDRREMKRYQAICRTQLGEAAFEAAWAEGRMMTLDQALDEAFCENKTLPGLAGSL